MVILIVIMFVNGLCENFACRGGMCDGCMLYRGDIASVCENALCGSVIRLLPLLSC